MAQADGDHIGRIRLARIANASADALLSAVADGVEPGAEVLTDGWKGYASLEAGGYRRQVVRAVAVVGENLLPRAHRVASLLQRWLLGTHQGAVAHTHLDTTWMSSHSGSIDGARVPAGCCSIGWSAKPWRSARFVPSS